MIVNSLTSKVHNYNPGSVDERKFFTVRSGDEKLYFDSKAEYVVYRILEDNPKLAPYKAKFINNSSKIEKNLDKFKLWVDNPISNPFEF